MNSAPASHLVHAFLKLFLALLCPVAITLVPLVLLQCCSWVTHIHRVELESQSQKPVPSSIVITPIPWSQKPAPLQGQSLSSKMKKKRFQWKRGVIWGWNRSATCLFQSLCSFPSYMSSKSTVQFPGRIAQPRRPIGCLPGDQQWSVLGNLFPSHSKDGEWLREDRILNNHCHSDRENTGRSLKSWSRSWRVQQVHS